MARPAGKSKGHKPSEAEPGAAWRKTPNIVRNAQRLGRMIPNEELRLMPKDLSGQIDHYVYGTPKR
jgi:hypothetical protein